MPVTIPTDAEQWIKELTEKTVTVNGQLEIHPYTWTGNTGTGTQIVYGFDHNDVRLAGNAPNPELAALSSISDPTQQNDIQASLQLISNFADITFINENSPAAETSANLVFARATSPSLQYTYINPDTGLEETTQLDGLTDVHAPTDTAEYGDVYLRDTFQDFSLEGPGSNLVLHEVMHALGLSHPDASQFPNGDAPNYNAGLTAMSYNFYQPTPTSGLSPIPYTTTPSVFDIATLQYLYGPNNSYESGNTFYEFNSSYLSHNKMKTIWDGGGTDLFFSSTGYGSRIDLRAGRVELNLVQDFANWFNGLDTLSKQRYLPLTYNTDGNDVFSSYIRTYVPSGPQDATPAHGYLVSSALAFGGENRDGIIEQAAGGSGHDLIFGNQLKNVLFGNNGDDAIFSGAGENILLGGLGQDIFVIETTSGANFIHGGFVRAQVNTHKADWDAAGHFTGIPDPLPIEGAGNDGNDLLSYANFDGGVRVVYQNLNDTHNGTVEKYVGANPSDPGAQLSSTDTFYSIEKISANPGRQNEIQAQGNAKLHELTGSGFGGSQGTLNFDGGSNFKVIANDGGNMFASLLDPSDRTINAGGDSSATNGGVDHLDYRTAGDILWDARGFGDSLVQAYKTTGEFSDTVTGVERISARSGLDTVTMLPNYNTNLDLSLASAGMQLAPENPDFAYLPTAGVNRFSYEPFGGKIDVVINQVDFGSFENSFIDTSASITTSGFGLGAIHTLSGFDPKVTSFVGGGAPEARVMGEIEGTRNDDTYALNLVLATDVADLNDPAVNTLGFPFGGLYRIDLAPSLGNDVITINGLSRTGVTMTYSGGDDTYHLNGRNSYFDIWYGGSRVIFDENLTVSDLTSSPTVTMDAQNITVTQIAFNFGGGNTLYLDGGSSLNGMQITFADGSGFYTVDGNGVTFVNGTPPAPQTEQVASWAVDDVTASALLAQNIYALGGDDIIRSDGRGHIIYGGPGVDTYAFTVGQGTGFDTFQEFDTGNIIKLIGVTDPTQFAYIQDGNDLRVETGSGFIIKDYFNNPDLFQEVGLDDGRIFQLSSLVDGTATNTGESYTVGNFDTISGTPADDTFTLTGIFASVLGVAGNDLFIGNLGDNNIDGGDGSDTLDYSSISDRNILIEGDSGIVSGLIEDEFGDTTLFGAEFFSNVENFKTGIGNDQIAGTAADNTFDAGAGDDFVYTGSGNNIVIGGTGFDDYDAFDGTNDTLSYAHTTQGIDINANFSQASGTEIDIDSFFGFEHYIGGSGDDTLSGGRWTNETLEGTVGNDHYIIYLVGNETTVLDSGGENFENSVQLFGWSGTQTQDVSLQDLRVSQNGNDLILSHLTTSSTVRFKDGMTVQPTTNVFFINNGQFEGFSYAEMLAALDTGGIIGGPPSNEAPIAQDDSFTGAEDAAVTGNVLTDNGNGADSDADGDTLSVTPATLTTAQGGTVDLLANGDFTYTPAVDFNGQDSFTYTVTDGNGGSDTATVTLDLSAVNDLPVAEADSFTTDEDTVLSGNLLVDNGNGVDSDVDGDSLSVVAETVTTTAGGSVNILANGDFTYTPAADFNGADSFSYTLDDGNGGTVVGNVSLTVNSINDAPLAADDTLVTDEDTATVVNVLTNDSDTENDTLAVSAVTDGANGTVIHDGTAVTYTPNANFFGTDSFTYTVSDGNGGFDTATVNVTVNPVNDNPIAADDSFTTDENVALVGNLLADNGNGTDSDIDGDTLSVTPATLTSAQGGTVDILANGDFTYTPAANYNGADSFSYTIDDGNGGAAVGSVSLTVNAVNDNPVAADDSFNTDEDVALVGNLLVDNGNGADSDVDGDTLYVVAETVTTAAGGSVDISANGDFTYTPAVNFNGADSFSYTLDDGKGGTVVGNVSLTVNPINDAPNATDDTLVTNEDTAAIVNALGNDNDADNDTLSISAVTNGASGTVTHDGASVTYTPNTDFFGTDSFTYTVSDGNGGFDTATVDVTVNSVNDTPIANDDAATTDEDAAVMVDVLANDTDVENDTLSVSAVTNGASGTVTHNGISVTYTPNAGFNGTDSFTYTVSDGNGGFDTATVNVTVDPMFTNTPPVANDDDFSVEHGNALTGNLLADNGNGADSDADNDNLTITAAAIMTLAGASVTLLTNGDFSYEGATGFVGTDSFEYTLEDGNGGFDTAFANITVTAPAGAVVGDSGDDTLNTGIGSDTIFAGEGNNTVATGSGSDTIYAGNGDDDLNSGSGDDVIYAGGGDNIVLSGSGDDMITSGDGDDVIESGSGHDTIYSGGGNDDINSGSGDDIIYAGAGNDIISAGSGDDFLAGGFGMDIMTGGSGADTFYFGSTDAVDTITDFSLFDDDTLNIADLLTGFDPLSDALGDWANISESGSDSILSVDQDGLGSAFSMTQLALLQGETGLGTVDDLLASGHLVVV